MSQDTSTRTPKARKQASKATKSAPKPVVLPASVLGVKNSITVAQARALNTKASDARFPVGVALAMLQAKGKITVRQFAEAEGMSLGQSVAWAQAGALLVRIGGTATISDAREAFYLVGALKSGTKVAQAVGDASGTALTKAIRKAAEVQRSIPKAEPVKRNGGESSQVTKATTDASRLQAAESTLTAVKGKTKATPAMLESLRTIAAHVERLAHTYGVDLTVDADVVPEADAA